MRQQFRHVGDVRRPYLDRRNLVEKEMQMVCGMANQPRLRLDVRRECLLLVDALLVDELQIRDERRRDAHRTLADEIHRVLLDARRGE
jgi:hypothetical protein